MVGQTGFIFGYARVSSIDQNEARQVQALGKVDRLYVDRTSGATLKRPQLELLLEMLREHDIVKVKSPDRLARSTVDLLDVIANIQSKGAHVQFVDNPSLNTNSPQGKFMLTILGAVAELERATIRERQAEGIAIAKKKGVYRRPPALSPEQIAHARTEIQRGVPKARLAREFGVSRQTLLTALKSEGVYANN